MWFRVSELLLCLNMYISRDESPSAWDAAFAGVEVAVHCAAPVSISPEISIEEDFIVPIIHGTEVTWSADHNEKTSDRLVEVYERRAAKLKCSENCFNLLHGRYVSNI